MLVPCHGFATRIATTLLPLLARSPVHSRPPPRNSFDSQGSLAFLLVGAPQSGLRSIPDLVASVLLGETESPAPRYLAMDVHEAAGAANAARVKRVLYDHVIRWTPQRTVVAVRGLELLEGDGAGVLNAFLEPLNHDRPMVSAGTTRDGSLPTADCQKCVFFFLMQLHDETPDAKAQRMQLESARGVSEQQAAVKDFLDRRFGPWLL